MPISKLEFSHLAPQLVDIYIEAMGYSPSMRAQRIDIWRHDTTEPGWQCVIAHDGTHLLGVAYGHDGRANSWWTRQISRGLFEHGGPSQHQREVLADFFELTEIHVAPRYQRQGIGMGLLQALLALTTRPYVLLSTPEVDLEANNAFGLYRAVGFSDFMRSFVFRGDPRPFAILEAALPLQAGRH